MSWPLPNSWTARQLSTKPPLLPHATRIAHAIGYDNSNMISMIKTGRTRMPAEKVVPFAKAVGHDPKTLLRHWFAAYMSEVLPDVERYLASPPR